MIKVFSLEHHQSKSNPTFVKAQKICHASGLILEKIRFSWNKDLNHSGSSFMWDNKHGDASLSRSVEMIQNVNLIPLAALIIWPFRKLKLHYGGHAQSMKQS